jgi:signal transduction histidine kinase
VTVSVIDRGLGLDAEQAERVFERFYRAGDPVGGAPRGVGLGLFLCRRLIAAQGGRIWVESTPGMGSRFRFTLPTLIEPELSVDDPRPSAAVSVVDDAAGPAAPVVPGVPVGVAG